MFRILCTYSWNSNEHTYYICGCHSDCGHLCSCHHLHCCDHCNHHHCLSLLQKTKRFSHPKGSTSTDPFRWGVTTKTNTLYNCKYSTAATQLTDWTIVICFGRQSQPRFIVTCKLFQTCFTDVQSCNYTMYYCML